MRTLTGFLSWLPGIMPRKARTLVLEGGLLSERDRADIHEGQGFYGTLEVGPDAGAAILAAYRRGGLPMARGKTPGDAPRADAYLADGESMRAQIAERRRRAAALRDISLATEVDLGDHAFLDGLFLAHLGTGAGTLVIAGREVTKDLAMYPSNSGKSRGWGVSFSWKGSDGRAMGSTTLPPEAGNRRNDAERNWGLYE